MEWRLRESGHGGWFAVLGAEVKNQPNPFGIGNIMPAFITYESVWSPTKEQAEQYIARRMKEE